RLALCCALSAKVAANELVVIDGLTFDAPKTKNVVAMLNAFDAATAKALLITNGCENVELSARNMPKVTTITNMGLNCFDILHANKVFLAKEVVEKIEEVLA
ncbi:MAG: 50S ribosomal protein L4, partial [Phascolarctobacterium sp.]|nr:50S ribosomal protein L4 [Phascolarctobacterium sp.]